uniref:Uncharacterized protein n=1 Tax=Apteryx owenii TaxID=8824 RepID=A0A8B9P831_APTOW
WSPSSRSCLESMDWTGLASTGLMVPFAWQEHSPFCWPLFSAAPLGSISSMEVNVDMLEQMDMMDLSDQDTVDVFLGCGTEESSTAGPLPGADASQCPEEITLQVPSEAEAKSRISSTSSVSTDPNSLDTSEDGAETPVVQSDEEDLQEDSPKEQVARS